MLLIAGYFVLSIQMGYFVRDNLAYRNTWSTQPVGFVLKTFDQDFDKMYLLGNLWKMLLLFPGTVLMAVGLSMKLQDSTTARWIRSAKSYLNVRGLIAATALLTLVLLFLRMLVLEGQPVYDDERVYLFQSGVFRAGRLFIESPPAEKPFENTFIVMHDGRWFGKYSSGHPALLALSRLAGSPWILPFLMALAIPWLAYRAGRYFFDDRTALLGAGLLLVSPAFLFTASTVMPHVSALFFLLLFMVCYLRSDSDRNLLWPFAAGLAMGAAFNIRPQDAVAFGMVFAAWSVAKIVKEKKVSVALRQVIMLVGFLILLAWFFKYNDALSGDWKTPPYRVMHSKSHLGFGQGPSGKQHDLLAAITNGLRNGQRMNLWLFGWPLSLIFVFSRVARGGIDRKEAPLVGIVLGFAGLFLLFPVAGVLELGARYYFPVLPVLTLWTAAEIFTLHRVLTGRFSTVGRAMIPIFVGLSIVLAGLTFGVEKVLHFMNLSARVKQVETIAEAKVEKPAVVEIYSKIPSGWVFGNPIPDPELESPILYLHHAPKSDILKALDWLEEREGRPRNYYRFWYDSEEKTPYIQKLSRETLEAMAKDGATTETTTTSKGDDGGKGV